MSRFPTLSILTLAALCAGAFAAEYKHTATDVTIHNIPYTFEKKTFEGRLVVPNPAFGAMPLVVLYPDWMGVSRQSTDDAKRLALTGYAVFVVDLYGKGVRPRGTQEAGNLAGPLKANVARLRQLAGAGLTAAKQQTGVDSNRVALLGFCFGGNAALELARSGANVRGTASVHGNLKTPFPEDARKIRGKVLALHGAADPHVPPAEVDSFKAEMFAGAVDLKFVAYEGAVHGFSNPKANMPERGVAYNHAAAEAAWAELGRFFGEVLGR